MKKIILIALMAIAFMVTPISADEKKAEPKYKITIEVVYNAVSIKEADRITANARREHVDACTVKIESKKVSGNDYGLVTTANVMELILN